MRAVGLDLGRRRTGVAVSDSAGRVATPHTVIRRTDDDAAFRAAVAGIVTETGADAVVVGLPLSLDGSEGPAAHWAQEEAAELVLVVGVPVYFHDERLTSVAAGRAAGGRTIRRRAADRGTDSRAAAIMLQSWLDSPDTPDKEVE